MIALLIVLSGSSLRLMGQEIFILARCPSDPFQPLLSLPWTRAVDARSRTADLEDEAKDSVIVPGEVEESEFWIRAGSEDADMPPADSHRKPLSDKEREIIRNWIKSGANGHACDCC